MPSLLMRCGARMSAKICDRSCYLPCSGAIALILALENSSHLCLFGQCPFGAKFPCSQCCMRFWMRWMRFHPVRLWWQCLPCHPDPDGLVGRMVGFWNTLALVTAYPFSCKRGSRPEQIHKVLGRARFLLPFQASVAEPAFPLSWSEQRQGPRQSLFQAPQW